MPQPPDPFFDPGGPLAAFAEDARMVGHGPAPEPSPGLLAVMGRGVVPLTETPRRKSMLVQSLVGSLAARVAMGIGLATAGVTAAGAAGVLPAAAQHAVATVVGAATPFQMPDDTSGQAPGTVRAPEDRVDPTTTTSVPRTTTSLPSPTAAVTGPARAETDRDDNHGACVSTVAQDRSLTGEDHGKAVSAVAQSDCGKPSPSTSTTVVRPTTTTSTTSERTAADKGNRGKGVGGSVP